MSVKFSPDGQTRPDSRTTAGETLGERRLSQAYPYHWRYAIVAATASARDGSSSRSAVEAARSVARPAAGNRQSSGIRCEMWVWA